MSGNEAPKKLPWFTLLAAQVPLVGAAYGLRDEIAAHPWGAAGLALLTEVGLFVVGLFVKVWKDELERDVVKALAGWVRAGFLNLVSTFRREYLQQLLYDHRTFNVRGLRTTGAHALELDQVFVELRIARSHPQQASTDLLTERELPEAGPIWGFLHAIAKTGATALAIIGPPGSGKTTLLQHVALMFARNHQRKLRLPAYVPILLFLREHVEAIIAQDAPRLGALAEAKARKSGHLRPPPGWFEKVLRQGRAIVLLDGLDEVAKEEQRLLVSRWVEQQMSAYPRAPFVLTARPQGYQSAPLERAHVLEVLPFGPEQVRNFVDRWYLANEITKRGGKDDPGVRQEAERHARDLLKRLREHPAFGALARNPLLLTMIAMVHNYRGALPGRRVELYAEICDVLLGHWQKSKGLDTPLTAAQLRVALQPLAAHMMTQGVRWIGASEALSVMESALAEIGVTDDAVKEFLKAVQARSGLLIERERGQWAFAHLSFQEYLAAAHFQEKGWPIDLAEAVGRSWWTETLRLYSAQADATPILEACLQAGNIQALTLACECLEEAKKAAPELRKRIHEVVEEKIESEDEQEFHLAAQVRLERRLRSMHRIDDERTIDSGYVTCAEYQLFLHDMCWRGGWRQPDHWQEARFAKGEARRPIFGIRGEDASAFVDWLNEREVVRRYRLPTIKEVGEHPATPEGLGTWCREAAMTPVLDELNVAGVADALRELRGTAQTEIPLPQELDAEQIESIISCDLDLGLDLGLGLGLDLALTRALNLALPLIPALTLNLANALNLARARDLDLALDLDLDLARARDLARSLARSLDRSLARTLDFDLDLARARAGDFALDRFELVIGQLERLPAPSSETERRRRTLLRDLLDLLIASRDKTMIQARRAARRHVMHVLEYTWVGERMRLGEATGRSLKDVSAEFDEMERHLIAGYWWLRLVEAEEAGEVPVWGGIRLVREEPSEEN